MGTFNITQSGQTTLTAVFDSDCFRPPTLDLAWQEDGNILLIKQLCNPPVSGVAGVWISL